MKQLSTILISLFIFVGGTCDRQASVDDAQEKETQQMVAEAHQRLGMPNINNYTERRMFKEILEKRDDTFTTYSYIMDMQGDLHLLCESVGYGIPFSTQYTNPERVAEKSHNYGYAILPQPDPNGLFMPTSSSATYVMCGNGDDLTPVYVENELLVSPFEIDRSKW